MKIKKYLNDEYKFFSGGFAGTGIGVGFTATLPPLGNVLWVFVITCMILSLIIYLVGRQRE